ncbi:MAG: site-specific DNA-methyltransferase [Mycoplasma sp.]|nr:site-specific DNA-methyltransferase [Mycoplasma sp.]
MSINISKEKRNSLIKKVKDIYIYISSVPQDKNTANLLKYLKEIEKEISAKKYGLIFEEHKETIDEILENNIPVLKEDASLFIDNGGQMDFLIEGDNLASLHLLERTHKSRIDLIYIDPPYNTGHEDFIYNDKMIDNTDGYRHSKWLSFMNERLLIAKKLLTCNGVMFISIDDNEYASLKMLCNKIFGEHNIETMIWRKVGDGDAGAGKMKATNRYRIEHEYILVCYQNKDKTIFKRYKEKPDFKNSYKNLDNDPRGPYKVGNISKIEENSNPNGKNYYEVKSPTGKVFKRQWQFDYPTFMILDADNRIYWGKNGNSVPGKKIFINEPREVVPSSVLLNTGSTTMGNKLIKEVFGDVVFNNSKPIKLMEYLIDRISSNNFTILDFFAGSGTTGHAVMELNAKDNGNRKFIICTNNENNICRGITYERIKKFVKKENYKASLKYMKIDFVPITDKFYYEYADELLKNVKELVELENAINFNGNKELAIILTEEELDDFTNNIPRECKTIYLGHDILPTKEQETLFKKNKIKINIIPDYYYRDLEV